ncbi:MAG: DUF6390 family protein, partial [Candidatus Kapaibacteriota bacterium]
KVPTALFYSSSSYPKNVLAPFWGDHHYHTNEEQSIGYKPTKIYYKSDPDRGVFIVEWRYLNINDVNVKSSIATFQLRLYKSQDPYSAQGDIEFAYGQVGGNDNTNDTRVITRNASVGIKGDFDPADFLNGLEYGKDVVIAKTSMRLTNEWAPSGGTDHRIRFRAFARFNVEEFWGDGDVDLSKGYNRKHYNMPQSRYVTVADARLILRSVATGIPLDSVRRRAAYHGDVNHNGRFYYDQNGDRKEIRWRNKYYGDSLPAEIGSIKQIFYQVNEYDAALILHYISARIPELPWIYDTVPQYGKLTNVEVANNLIFGEPEVINNKIRFPIYLNGEYSGPLSVFVELNEPFVLIKNNSNLLVDFENNRGVIAGSGNFSSNEPIAFLVVENSNLVSSNYFVRFNENVVKAYWIGNQLLEKVSIDSLKKMIIKEFVGPGFISKRLIKEKIEKISPMSKPHHSFHVLVLGSVSGRVFLKGKLLDFCRIGWGKVIAFKNKKMGSKEGVIIKYQPIFKKNQKYFLGKPVKKFVFWDRIIIPKLKIGDM